MVLKMADLDQDWKSLQTLWNASYMLANAFLVALGTVCVEFGWILKGPKLAVFEQKPWAIAHGFENGGFGSGLEIAPNSLKRFLYARKCVSSCFGTFCVDFGWILKGPKLAVFEQKAWAIAHGFENGGFGSGLEIAPNSLKRFLYARKCVSSCFGACLCRFWVNSQGSEIGRFWAKTLGYSPWFWKWRIWVRAGNRSKLSETLPICSKMRF